MADTKIKNVSHTLFDILGILRNFDSSYHECFINKDTKKIVLYNDTRGAYEAYEKGDYIELLVITSLMTYPSIRFSYYRGEVIGLDNLKGFYMRVDHQIDKILTEDGEVKIEKHITEFPNDGIKAFYPSSILIK